MTVGLLDASVVIDWHDPAVASALPDELAISAITLAELAAGPHAAASRLEAARRQSRLQEVEARFEPIPFDGAAAVSYGLVAAAVISTGHLTGRRLADLLVAATAHANGLTLYTRNGADFDGLGDLVEVVTI